MNKYNMVQDAKVPGGTFLLNCCMGSGRSLESIFRDRLRRYMAEHNIKFYTIDGIKIGKEIGLGGRINTVLQSAFFKLANIIPADEAIQLYERDSCKSYLC